MRLKSMLCLCLCLVMALAGPALASARLPSQRGAVTDDADVLDLVFSANFMGMISASGKLMLREMPMNAELVLNGEGALDLSTASAEDMQAMQVNLQTSLQTLLLNAMSVPGVQQIMTITSVESVTPADDAATEVITEEATEVTDEAIAG